MTVKHKSPIVLQDSDSVKNVVIQVNLKNGTTMVMSGFSAWENLSVIMEALGVSAEQCISEGIKKREVYEEITEYLQQVLPSYEVNENLIN